MGEKINLTEYQIGDAVSKVSYLDSHQRSLVKAAIAIESNKRGGLDEGSTRDMLRVLDNAGLISSGAVDSLMKKLFNESRYA